MTLKLGAMIIALSMLIPAVGGCEDSSGDPSPPMPATFALSYMGSNYCGYRYTPYELDMYAPGAACTRVAFPSISAMPIRGSIQWLLAEHYATYSTWYDSGYWYDTYYAPTAVRYHVTIISRNAFTSNVTVSQRTYGGLIRSNASRATWRNPKGGTVTGTYNFPATNSKATKPPTNTRVGSDTDAGRARPGNNPAPAPKQPAAPVRKR